MDALILDKSVKDESRDEHQSFHWILNNEKIKKGDGEAYDINQDYLGHFPEKDSANKMQDLSDYSPAAIDSLANALDMVYYADAEGPANSNPVSGKVNGILEGSNFGGVSEKEYQLLRAMDNRNKLILAEYNTLAYPTSPEVRVSLEQLFKLKFSGWIGKHFSDLSKTSAAFPSWIPEAYSSYTNEEYNFSGEGIILVHETGKILVLRMDEHLSASYPMINTNLSNMDKWELPNFVSYPFWFDITFADDPDQVVSEYKIHTSDEGDSILKANGLSNKFPAVIGSEKGNRFYFCGDFANNPILQNLSYFKGINVISYLLKAVAEEPERKQFFWNYYRPLIINIINAHQTGIQLESRKVDHDDTIADAELYSVKMDSSSIESDQVEEISELNPVDTKNYILDNMARFRVGGRGGFNEIDQFSNEGEINATGEPAMKDNFNPISQPSETKSWRIVIASLQSAEGTKKYLKQLNNPEISAVWVAYLQTNRITFGPFDHLGQAQQKYTQVLQQYPDAWMIKF